MFGITLPWSELVRRAWKDSLADDIMGLKPGWLRQFAALVEAYVNAFLAAPTDPLTGAIELASRTA